jgi:hypothetical protein
MGLHHERTISPKKEKEKKPKERHKSREKDSPPKERRIFLIQGKKDKGK